MTLGTTLRRARELCLAGEHRVCGLLDEVGLVIAAADGNADLAFEALSLLDKCCGGDGQFSRFVDGGVDVVDGDFISHVYKYNRTPAEVAAVFGRAILYAKKLEEVAA